MKFNRNYGCVHITLLVVSSLIMLSHIDLELYSTAIINMFNEREVKSIDFP